MVSESRLIELLGVDVRGKTRRGKLVGRGELTRVRVMVMAPLASRVAVSPWRAVTLPTIRTIWLLNWWR